MAMACLGDVSCLGAEDEDTLLVSKKGDLEAGEKMVEMHDIKVKPEVVKDYTEEQLKERFDGSDRNRVSPPLLQSLR